MTRKPKICIVAHNACGAIRGGQSGHIGGVERQTSMLARWLAARGYDVSMVTWDEGQTDGEVVQGVKLFKICRRDAGWRTIRILHPRISGLIKALKRADADVYYHNCAEYYTGVVALWCARNKRKFVYSLAHDDGADLQMPTLLKRYERILYPLGIKKADLLVSQTEKQRRMLQEGFGCDSVVLPMPCPGPSDQEFVPPTFPEKPTVCWVGRRSRVKRLEWLLDVAERLPDVTFEIAAPANMVTDYSEALYERALTIPNIRWLGPVARNEIPALYQRATCLCCTSIHEGFPNTFLEAWSYGKPLITSFDPDGMVERLHLGKKCDTVDQFVVAIRQLVSDPHQWLEYSRNARRYYVENHEVDRAMRRFEEVFLKVTGLEQDSKA